MSQVLQVAAGQHRILAARRVFDEQTRKLQATINELEKSKVDESEGEATLVDCASVLPHEGEHAVTIEQWETLVVQYSLCRAILDEVQSWTVEVYDAGTHSDCRTQLRINCDASSMLLQTSY